MALKMTSTREVASSNGVNVLIYGQSGAGKTSLIKTLPEKGTLVLNAEAGLLPLAGTDYQVADIHSKDDLAEALGYVREHAGEVRNLVIDSLSEVAEIILTDEKEKSNNKDKRAAYGEMNDELTKILKFVRDIQGVNKFLLCKIDTVQDSDGRLVYGPSVPGNKATQGLPYTFDEVFALHVVADEDGRPVKRVLQTSNDGKYVSKDRSGKLAICEPANLSEIIEKIGGKA